ncbi:MAG: biopolymer transporter ExbD [Phycisphaerales bacterium]|jgi:biopolymer transport protein ExbD|nr:biopolymer transporter ExbD [Phycisphaerales bacterium]
MKRRGKTTSGIHANMTPMIDVTFLLIVFFVVVSQIVDRDTVAMDLPRPDHAASGLPEKAEHVVVNIIPAEDGDIRGFVVAGHELEASALHDVTSIVQTHLQGGAQEVHLRADKTTKYIYIHEVIEAIRAVGSAPRLQLIVSGDER